MHVFTFVVKGLILLYSGTNINILFQTLEKLCHLFTIGVNMQKPLLKIRIFDLLGKYGYDVCRTLRFGIHHVCYGVLG